MPDEYGSAWMSRLPWVMLGRRTAYQPQLDATAAEMVFGSNPMVPGDLIGEPGPPISNDQLKNILETLRQNAARDPIPTAHNRVPPINNPDLSQVTHVFVRRGKTATLGRCFDGPFEIIERVGKSCIRLRVGSFANGEPRYELQHWENCRPAHLAEGSTPAEKPKAGRKPLNHKAPEFLPSRPLQNNKETPVPFSQSDNSDKQGPQLRDSLSHNRPIRSSRNNPPRRYTDEDK